MAEFVPLQRVDPDASRSGSDGEGTSKPAAGGQGPSQSIRLRDLTGNHTTKVFRPIPQDMWGVTILLAVGDMPNVASCRGGWETVVRMLFGVIAVGVNLWLQLTILWYVWSFIIGQAVHDTQDNYAQYHREVFDENGKFLADVWADWKGPYMALCNLAVSKWRFTMAIVFIWTTRMLGEFRAVERLQRDIHAIERLPDDAEVADMLYTKPPQSSDDDSIEEFHVIALSRFTRALLYIFVLIPKLFIVVVLMLIGCRWLAATESFSELILNALALEFIIGVDELIFVNFAPQRMQEWVTNTKILHLKKKSGKHTNDVVWVYFKSILYMSVAFAWSYFYLNNFQQVIPGFTHDILDHCDGWFQKKYEPICLPFGKNCFPFGDEDQ